MRTQQFSLLLLLLPFVSAYKTITLNETNSVVIRGSITDKVADDFINALIMDEPNFVYIYSNGGSVMAGNRIVMQLLERDITCIAERAYSMAFVILQACKYRYIIPTATAMQHQQSMGNLRGDLYAITGYIEMVHSIENYLTKLQATRIGMDEDKFRTLSSVEWWMFGDKILENGVADEMVHIQCTPELAEKQIVKVTDNFFGTYTETYSACPLLLKPIEQEFKDTFFKINITDLFDSYMKEYTV
jgi:ATP-dependent protease ClpP protease subunit